MDSRKSNRYSAAIRTSGGRSNVRRFKSLDRCLTSFKRARNWREGGVKKVGTWSDELAALTMSLYANQSTIDVCSGLFHLPPF